MYDTLIEFFLLRPARLITTGRTLFQLGTMVIVAGLCGRVTTAGATAIQGLSRHVAIDTTLAALYPSLPTWWVPENALGYSICGFSALVGLVLVRSGKTMERIIGR